MSVTGLRGAVDGARLPPNGEASTRPEFPQRQPETSRQPPGQQGQQQATNTTVTNTFQAPPQDNAGANNGLFNFAPTGQAGGDQPVVGADIGVKGRVLSLDGDKYGIIRRTDVDANGNVTGYLVDRFGKRSDRYVYADGTTVRVDENGQPRVRGDGGNQQGNRWDGDWDGWGDRNNFRTDDQGRMWQRMGNQWKLMTTTGANGQTLVLQMQDHQRGSTLSWRPSTIAPGTETVQISTRQAATMAPADLQAVPRQAPPTSAPPEGAPPFNPEGDPAITLPQSGTPNSGTDIVSTTPTNPQIPTNPQVPTNPQMPVPPGYNTTPGNPNPGNTNPGGPTTLPGNPGGTPGTLPGTPQAPGGYQGQQFGGQIFAAVRELLTAIFGESVRDAQVRQFLQNVNYQDLRAFLTNPNEALPRVMSALMQVFGQEPSRGRGQTDGLLQLFDSLLAHRPSPGEVRNFFNALSTLQIQHLITHRAEVIGNLPGVPHDVRYAANLQRAAAELDALQGKNPAEVRRMQTLEALLMQRAQLLHFDAGMGQLGRATASQVFGNLSEAQYVALMTFGRGNSMDTFAGLAQRAQLVQEVAQPMMKGEVAVVAWLETLSPALGRQYAAMLAGWQAKSDGRSEAQFLQLMQQAAARQMTEQTLPGLLLRGDARLTFIGHSFGSSVLKETLQQGAKPDACVFLGLPEHRLKRVARQSGCGETDLYGLLNEGDLADELANQVEAPEELDSEAFEPDDDIDWLDPGRSPQVIEAVLEPHQDYLLEGSASLGHVVNVMLGRETAVLPPKPQVITLYRSVDGIFGGDALDPVAVEYEEG